jgi:hypothetical protein
MVIPPTSALVRMSVGLPAALEQDVDAFLDLFLETVIEVVEHLLDEFLVVQFRQDDVVFFVGHGRVSCCLARRGPFSNT